MFILFAFQTFFGKLKQICIKAENIKGIYRNERQIEDKYGEKNAILVQVSI